ncbi:MAG: Uma2 family endonuclease [Xanthobacteraceae bacterium]
MNVQTQRAMDSAAFLAWAEGREGRYELARGRVIMMTGGWLGHALVVRGLAAALDRRLNGTRWIALTSDFAVRIETSTVRYPDVVVVEQGGKLHDLATTAPALIAEVPSPPSVTNDLGDKAAEYLRLESVSAYFVLSQEEPKAWVWVRQKSGFPVGAEVIGGLDAVIRITPLSVDLPLAEIYRDFPKTDGEA